MRKIPLLLSLGFITVGILSCYGYGRVDNNKYEATNNIGKESKTDALKIIGAGTFVYGGFFKVYDVVLYSNKSTVDHTTRPKIIKFHYLRSIPKNASIKATEQAILLNATKEEVENFGDDWQLLLSFYEDTQVGDMLTVIHDENGLQLSYPKLDKFIKINNQLLAEKFCSIWLGPQPLNKNLRAALLGVPK